MKSSVGGAKGITTSAAFGGPDLLKVPCLGDGQLAHGKSAPHAAWLRPHHTSTIKISIANHKTAIKINIKGVS